MGDVSVSIVAVRTSVDLSPTPWVTTRKFTVPPSRPSRANSSWRAWGVLGFGGVLRAGRHPRLFEMRKVAKQGPNVPNGRHRYGALYGIC